ncbi:hypothetical protein [Alkalicoccus chagannorensis]|uniref:hypothetical protein n=1 Tax=Alkalicoccus chagannorensis TaxID=427072 RepID=UPI00040A682B|nr:hypothetical protein [Alkalicoccus chagannorensis]
MRYGNPFLGRYLRYVTAWLALGIFVPIFTASLWISLLSVLAAAVITVGIDAAGWLWSKKKAEAFTGEPLRWSAAAVKTSSDWRGYLMATDQYFIFVPCFHKITSAASWKDMVSYEMEGAHLHMYVKQQQTVRSLQFVVSSPEKTALQLKESPIEGPAGSIEAGQQ